MRRADFETVFENTAKDHRFQADFWFPSAMDEFWAESGFDLVKRKIEKEQPPEKPAASDLAKLILGSEANYAKRPDPEFRMPGITAGLGMAVAGRGLKEAEAFKDESANRTRLSLTLCRAIGYLARPDLAYRTGLAGPPLEVPGAQCLREFSWDYSLILFSGPVEKSAVFADAYHFVFPPLAFPGMPLAMMPFKMADSKIMLSALYVAKDGRVIARFFNAGVPGRARLSLTLAHNVTECFPGQP